MFQAALFEILAISLSTLIFAWAMGTGFFVMGAFSLVVSLAAVVWNIAFNAGFDRLRRRLGFDLTIRTRMAHAIGFEGGLTLATLPLTMWWLGLEFRAALAFDGATALFFLVFTYAYHWAYDASRERLLSRQGLVR